jgi:methionyl aminopeptidase
MVFMVTLHLLSRSKNITPEVRRLLKVTRESLYKGISAAVIGNRVGDISFHIQHYCEKIHGYSIVRELVGHGVGRNLHEDPEVPNFGQRGKGPILKDGLVLAIEPMVNLGIRGVKQLNDGWTILTKDGKPSAHYEHSVAIRKMDPIYSLITLILMIQLKKMKKSWISR